MIDAILWILFCAGDVYAYSRVPHEVATSHWYYKLPGGGFIIALRHFL